ncbi:MAG: methylmalonyl-CoA mutase, partial [Xanthomonadales bacterium]|nr:methylmalonyl-CoA mutase [Xanthomonadales bacterium]
DEDVPLYPTIAIQFNDPVVSWMFVNVVRLLREKLDLPEDSWATNLDVSDHTPKATVLIPGNRTRYLAEIAEQGREINQDIETQAQAASLAQNYYECLKDLSESALPASFEMYGSEHTGGDGEFVLLRQRYDIAMQELSAEAIELLEEWPARKKGIRTEQYAYEVRGREITGNNYKESLSKFQIPKIGMPRDRDWGELLSFLMRENLPGERKKTPTLHQ